MRPAAFLFIVCIHTNTRVPVHDSFFPISNHNRSQPGKQHSPFIHIFPDIKEKYHKADPSILNIPLRRHSIYPTTAFPSIDHKTSIDQLPFLFMHHQTTYASKHQPDHTSIPTLFPPLSKNVVLTRKCLESQFFWLILHIYQGFSPDNLQSITIRNLPATVPKGPQQFTYNQNICTTMHKMYDPYHIHALPIRHLTL